MKVGIIGTGTLGPSIAQVFSQCDQVEKVYLCKGRESSSCTGLEAIQSSYNKLIRKEKLDQETVNRYLKKIKTGPKPVLKDADLIVEAVVENLQVKREVFQEIDGIFANQSNRGRIIQTIDWNAFL